MNLMEFMYEYWYNYILHSSSQISDWQVILVNMRIYQTLYNKLVSQNYNNKSNVQYVSTDKYVPDLSMYDKFLTRIFRKEMLLYSSRTHNAN